MLTKLKEKVQSWVTAEAKLAHNVGLTPNHVSALGIIFAGLSAIAYTYAHFHLLILAAAPILLLISGFCDALDGAIARIHGKTTTFGKFLDSVFDRIADAAILSGIIIGGLCDMRWGIIALIGSFMVSYARARAEALGVGMEAVGIAERAERLIILAVASFLSLIWSEALSWAVVVLALLTSLTVLQRMAHFLRASKSRE